MSLSQNKVTDNTHEMSFHELLSQSAQLRIPLFQRPYVWKQKQLKRMQEELESIVEGVDQNRFLGAIIAVRRSANPAAPQPFEIVDGQQRLTTLYLFVLAAAQVAESLGLSPYARSLINQNVIIDWHTTGTNTKVVPGYFDRAQFNEVFKILFNTGSLGTWLPERTRTPAPSGEPIGDLSKQFDRIRRYLKRLHKNEGEQAFYDTVEAARTKLTYVFILLKDPSTATTVFQGLNDPGIPIGVGDLVRNDIFSRVGEDADVAYSVHNNSWVPFQNRLGDDFNNFFFPYSVVHKPATLRADMFRELRSLWDDASTPGQIISDMGAFVGPFLSIAREPMPTYDKEVQQALQRLIDMKRPAAVFPFVMKLLAEYEKENVSASQVVECLTTLEAFLVRRALCGVEPTGLLGMFRTMWNVMLAEHGPASGVNLAKVIYGRQTIDWPDDDRVRQQVRRRKFYKSSISQFVLLQYERSLSGDFPAGIEPWVEHVMPQKLTDDWKALVSEESHQQLVDTWANLIPLSAEMNTALGQKLYSDKRAIYQADSAFKTARTLAEEYATWDADRIKERADKLAAWAVSRWPRTTI